MPFGKNEFYKQYTLQLSPFPAYIMFEVATSLARRYAGSSLGTIVSEFENGISRGYFIRKEVLDCGNEISEKLLVGKIRISNVFFDFKQLNVKLQKMAVEINKSNLAKMQGTKLSSTFADFAEIYAKTFTVAVLPFLCDFSLAKMAGEELEAELGFKKATIAMSALSAPTGISWVKEEEMELAALAKKAQAKGIGSVSELKKTALANEFNFHISNWRWLPYDYQGEPLSDSHFEERLNHYLKNPKKIIDGIKHAQKKTEKERQNAFKIFKKGAIVQRGANHKGAKMALLLGELAYFKEYRKGLMSKSLYLIEPLLKEIAKRIGIHISRARFLWPSEVGKALNEPAKWNRELESRYAYFVYIQTSDGYEIYTGSRARQELKKIRMEKMGDEIKGTIACMGLATGRVRIIVTPFDLHKMRKGDILVSPMTTPDLVPAIKLAAGIITDTGGMTSHAATISREFKIPCIIGTQHATEILKDGEKVEVDANKGIVKRIK
ncbi:MAG: PEP-utilizing enzyme [Candidatus Micrarchaeota archaeon]